MRFLRYLRKIAPWLVVAGVAFYAWWSDEFLALLLYGLGLLARLAFALFYMIIQFAGIFWFMSRSKVEIIRPGDPKGVTFDDYWGQPNLKRLVSQWISLLAERDEFVKMGGQYINGLLLYGLPGTGKTMLAKAMAGEASVAFISMEGSGFRAMFFGIDVLKMIWFVGKARKMAREYGACIAYIDEIDAVGMSRSGVMGGGPMMGMGGGSGALTRLLYEMDGIGEMTRWERWLGRLYKLLGKKPPPRDWHVLYMGSTNRPDVLDPALLRPGRFDQMIEVTKPDRSGRREIVRGYLSRIKHDHTVDVEALVEDTANTTPAQIMSAITKDAVRIALFDGRRQVSQSDIEKAFQEQWMGIENPVEEMEPAQRRQIAIHEAGHAVAQHYLMPERRIVRVSIIRRARGTLGYVMPVDRVEVYVQPLRRLVAEIMVSMAGHVATKIFLGEHWTGAYSDFNHVRNEMAHLYILGYFGPPVGEPGDAATAWDGRRPAPPNDNVLKRFWSRLELQVERMLLDHYDELNALAIALLEKNDLSTREVLEILGPNDRPESGPARAPIPPGDGKGPQLPQPQPTG